MKSNLRLSCVLGILFFFTIGVNAQDPHVDTTLNANDIQCDSDGRVDRIYYTSCFKRLTGSPDFETDDTERLKAILQNSIGKIVFNEPVYYISEALPVYSYRLIEGTGKGSVISTGFNNSKIVLTEPDESVFKIGEGVYEVSIKNLTLINGAKEKGAEDNIGILAEGANTSSLHFDFSNIRFSGFGKGISINATNNEWQFDHVKMDHLTFEDCFIGIYVNSFNAGLDIRAINFLTPVDGYGIYMLRGTYTSIDTLIGNGPFGGGHGEALVYIKEHGIMSIKNSVGEGYDYDVYLDGVSYSYPVHLINNHFQAGVYLKYSTVVSTANQYGHFQTHIAQPDVVADNALIYSFGDKFCFETIVPTYCDPTDPDRNFQLINGAKLLFSSGEVRNYTSLPTFNDGDVSFGTGKTITIGSTSYSSLGTPANGTLFYCTDCQQTSTCSSGGSGAFAKRINGSWKCN